MFPAEGRQVFKQVVAHRLRTKPVGASAGTLRRLSAFMTLSVSSASRAFSRSGCSSRCFALGTPGACRHQASVLEVDPVDCRKSPSSCA